MSMRNTSRGGQRMYEQSSEVMSIGAEEPSIHHRPLRDHPGSGEIWRVLSRRQGWVNSNISMAGSSVFIHLVWETDEGNHPQSDLAARIIVVCFVVILFITLFCYPLVCSIKRNKNEQCIETNHRRFALKFENPKRAWRELSSSFDGVSFSGLGSSLGVSSFSFFCSSSFSLTAFCSFFISYTIQSMNYTNEHTFSKADVLHLFLLLLLVGHGQRRLHIIHCSRLYIQHASQVSLV